jgi:geranylgeranyl pyrophosphate synthase
MKATNFMQKYISLIEKSNAMKQVMPSSFKLLEEKVNFGFGVNYMGKPDTNSIYRGFLVPTNDLLARPRKMWRPAFTLMIAQSLGVDIEDVTANSELYFTIALCEIVHNASLILDDIEKNAQTRRGETCIHHKYGLNIALNSGSLLYFKPLAMIKDNIKNNAAEYYSICMDELTRIHIGQCLDLSWMKCDSMPSEDYYIYMLLNKSSVVPRMGVRLLASILRGKIMSKQGQAINELAEGVGAAFQIMEDYSNFHNYRFGINKDLLSSEITLGKKSLMTIHSYSNSDACTKKRINEIWGTHLGDPEIVAEGASYLLATRSDQYALDRANKLIKQCWEQAEPLLESCAGKSDLGTMLSHILEKPH